MAMSERAYAYQSFEAAQSLELRKLRVLSGAAIREKANARRIDMVKIALLVTTVLVYFLGVTFMESKIGDVGAEINSLKEQITDTENDSLRADLKIGELSSLDRIEAYATENLDMVPTAGSNVYYLNKESSMMISQGEQQLVESETESAPVEQEQHPFWQSLAIMVHNYFDGTALAADSSQ